MENNILKIFGSVDVKITPDFCSYKEFARSQTSKIISLSLLKYGFHKKSFILNATLVSCPFPSSLLGGFAVAPTQK
jgi:hypothetical protein